MKAFYNNKLVEDSVTLNINDRAYQFGDGLFETLLIKDRKPQFLDHHFERLGTGCEILDLQLPWKSTQELLSSISSFLKRINESESNFKLIVWRKPSELGGYNSDSSACNFLFLHRPIPKVEKIIRNADFARSITFHYSELSPLKTLNSLPYIIASNEKRQRELDEIIVLNNEGYICECSSSNIFWVKNGIYYTPPIKSGCLDGVRRRVVIERIKSEGKNLEEVMAKPEDLLKAETVFTTNSLAIRFIKKIGDVNFDIRMASSPLFCV